ncbi:hypothetical protein AYI68_g6288 [Smittium mucronatum]|uniref:Uncharacterized protein n=1 Tax=Smittium mucronatum TaxID=133383 RepID=A0A1R0GS09_9FUNG|nr:hypothetical protein AYI68_g6288 [Smittium mucronatum]
MNEAEARADTARKLAERMRSIRLNSPQYWLGLAKNEIMSRLPLPEIIPGLRCASKTFGGTFEQISYHTTYTEEKKYLAQPLCSNCLSVYTNNGVQPSSKTIQKLLCQSASGRSKMWMRGDTMTSCIPMNSSADPQSVCITMKVIKPSLNSRGILLDGKINPVYKHLMIDIVRYKIESNHGLNYLTAHTMTNGSNNYKALIAVGSYDDAGDAKYILKNIKHKSQDIIANL